MNIVLYDDPADRDRLLPLSFTRPIAEFRVGILKISEKWQKNFVQATVSYRTASFLAKKYADLGTEESIYINGALLPSKELVQLVSELRKGEFISHEGQTIVSSEAPSEHGLINKEGLKEVKLESQLNKVHRPWDIFMLNREELIKDFELLTKNRASQPITDPFTRVYNPENVFLEEGASIKASIIDASSGPVYIGKHATVGAGSYINGAFALCEHGHVNACGNMKGDTTIGPHSKVGGEVSNSVIFGFSNKGHEGFMGNSVLGEWCNLGADTNTSNLKNNYSKVRVWDYSSKTQIQTELQFCGLIMGDHAKAGINTMFNTATVVGVCANVFGAGFPPKFIPSFSWGGPDGFVDFKMDKAIEVATAMMMRRKIAFTALDEEIFKEIEQNTRQFK